MIGGPPPTIDYGGSLTLLSDDFTVPALKPNATVKAGGPRGDGVPFRTPTFKID